MKKIIRNVSTVMCSIYKLSFIIGMYLQEKKERGIIRFGSIHSLGHPLVFLEWIPCEWGGTTVSLLSSNPLSSAYSSFLPSPKSNDFLYMLLDDLLRVQLRVATWIYLQSNLRQGKGFAMCITPPTRSGKEDANLLCYILTLQLFWYIYLSLSFHLYKSKRH
jgi:hypothetical protein